MRKYTASTFLIAMSVALIIICIALNSYKDSDPVFFIIFLQIGSGILGGFCFKWALNEITRGKSFCKVSDFKERTFITVLTEPAPISRNEEFNGYFIEDEKGNLFSLLSKKSYNRGKYLVVNGDLIRQ